jgi:SAM-dependent methyltransferase
MIHPRMIYDLCRYPMWLIDSLHVDNTNRTIIVDGWALAPHGDLMLGELSLNGRKPNEFQRRPSPELAKIFPWHENTEMSRFTAVFRDIDLDTEDALRISYVGRWTHDPFNRWQDIYFPLKAWRDKEYQEKVYVQPDEAQMRRTQGDESFFRYLLYGATVAHIMNQATQTYFGKDFSQFVDICDWGCGCARVIQAVRLLAPTANITGLDIDGDNIAWCKENISYASFINVPLFPPTQIPDGQFDLLYGISVFTHLTREAFEAWCIELHRIVCPGGIILVTINRGAGVVGTGREDLITRVIEDGFDDASIDRSLTDQISDATYYRATFLSTAEAMHFFGSLFRVRDILYQASGTSQDIVVCERFRRNRLPPIGLGDFHLPRAG